MNENLKVKSFAISEEQYADLKQHAHNRGMSVSAVIRNMVEQLICKSDEIPVVLHVPFGLSEQAYDEWYAEQREAVRSKSV